MTGTANEVLLTFSRQGSRDLEVQAAEVDGADEVVEVQKAVEAVS